MEPFSLAKVDTWFFLAAAAAWIGYVRILTDLRAHMRRDHWSAWERNGFTLHPSRLYRYFVFGGRYRELDDRYINRTVLLARLTLTAFFGFIVAQLLPDHYFE